MSPAAFATQSRRQIRHLIVSLLIVSSLLVLVACTSSAPPPATPKPAPTQGAAKPTSSPAAKASPQASPSPSPSPIAQNPIEILDATLADATPWVSLRLNEGEPTIVSGWRLEVGTQSIEIPGNAIIQPGETLTLWAGAGRSSDREIFLGPDSYPLALAATPGTRVRLLKTTGEVAAETTVPRF